MTETAPPADEPTDRDPTPPARQFSAREVPWAKVGAVIDHPVDAAEAARLGGLDFDIRLDPAGHLRPRRPVLVNEGVEPLATLRAQVDEATAGRTGAARYDALRRFGRVVPALLDQLERVQAGGWAPDPSRLAVVADDGSEEVFDYVSRDYRPVQFSDALSFMDSVSPRYVAAGTLDNRRQGFMVVQSPRLTSLDLGLGGSSDPHDLYLVLRTSHNRSRGLEVSLLPLRGRCMNQLPLRTFGTDAPQRWSIRHVGDPLGKLREAGRALDRLDRYAEVYARTARQLVETEVLLDDARTILDQTLQGTLHDAQVRGRTVSSIVDAWQHSDSVGFPTTGWGLVNATGEYLEHGRTARRTAQSRWLSGLDGPTSQAVNRVTQVVLQRRRAR